MFKFVPYLYLFKGLWGHRTRTMLTLTGTAVAIFVFFTFTGISVAAEGVSIAFRPSTNLAAAGAIVSVAVGVLAGVIPGCQAARTNVVDALRHTA